MSASIPTDDYYELLGLPQTCTEDEIKRAYRRLSRIVHPDKQNMRNNPKAKEIAEILNTANSTLMNRTTRYVYDQRLYEKMFNPYSLKLDAEALLNSMLNGESSPKATGYGARAGHDAGSNNLDREGKEDEEAQQEHSQRSWQQFFTSRQNAEPEDQEASIRAKWAELSHPFDSGINARWIKIQAMNDILKGLDKTDNEMEPKRGGCHCGWQHCPDRHCETTFEEGLIERGYSHRAVVGMKMLEQRGIYWQEIEEVE